MIDGCHIMMNICSVLCRNSDVNWHTTQELIAYNYIIYTGVDQLQLYLTLTCSHYKTVDVAKTCVIALRLRPKVSALFFHAINLKVYNIQVLHITM